MNAVVEIKDTRLPAPVAKRGISEAEWVTLRTSLFPGAKPESICLVIDYCRARKLDPLKKPCHIVPMQIKQGDDYVWRDVVMPGIYEYRTTAMRTKEYMGHSKPVYGPEIEYMGVKAPEFCELTVYRWNAAAGIKCEYPVTVYFSEVAGTSWDKQAKAHKINARWTKAPRQMLTKCAEAAALREAFPDELGGEQTHEELEGQILELPSRPTIDPRGDEIDMVDWEMRDKHVTELAKLFDELGSDEAKLGPALKDYVQTNLASFHELHIAVWDKLVADGIATKSYLRKLCA
jgi:phage recombination protein Bet